MAKDVVTVEKAAAPDVLRELATHGYSPLNPDTQLVHAFTADGDAIEIRSGGRLEIPEGAGVLLWRGAAESVYFGLVHGKPRIHLEGLTGGQAQQVLQTLSALGFSFVVAPEDTAYEA